MASFLWTPGLGACESARGGIIPKQRIRYEAQKNYQLFLIMSSLRTAILRTLAYYDTFDYPLTVEEVWRWLYPVPGTTMTSVTVDDVRREMVVLVNQNKIIQHGAYLVFPGREAIVQTRTERMERGLKLWRRATSTTRYLELVPFVKLIAVVNTLAIDNVRPESDIDLLIVVAPRHLWIARMIVSGIVTLMGNRRHGTKIAGRICLSFYITTDGMNFSPLKCAEPDTHFAFWTAQAVPLLDDGTYERFRQANDWVTKLVPNAWSWDWKVKLLPANAGLQSIKKFYEIFFSTPIGQWFESWARSYQIKRIDKHIESKAKLGTTEVVISEDVLKFHEQDRRQEYNERFERRLHELGIQS